MSVLLIDWIHGIVSGVEISCMLIPSLPLSLSFTPYLSPHPCPTIPPLFLIFPRIKVVQMALPCVGILDFPVSRSMSNEFLYNFLRLWHSIITAENWVAEKCLQKTWNFYIRKRITDRESSQMARIFEPVSQLQVT